MSDLAWLIIAISAFVAGHELLSHPFEMGRMVWI